MNDVTERKGKHDKILELEEAIKQSPEELDKDSAPVTHHFAPGCYGREILMKAGTLVIGKIHRHAHINILLEGHCTVHTGDEREELCAPYTWVSTPGIKRAVFNHTDVRWLTIHPTEETELDKIEAEVIAPSFENLLEAPCLGGQQEYP